MPQTHEANGGSAPEVSAQPLRILMPSPLGPIGVELTGTSVTLLRFEPSGSELSTFTPLHRIDGSDFIDEVFGRLSEYLAGARRRLDLAVDLGPREASPQMRKLLKETARIPYGRTRTYQMLAEAAHVAEGASGVAALLRENPIPILIPCHRAVATLQQIGDYVGGPERKRWLLDLERQGAELV
jgi:methylated-DNA-[protein]-cysteine S-methyltransferase